LGLSERAGFALALRDAISKCQGNRVEIKKRV
jgi:hypothetical protein